MSKDPKSPSRSRSRSESRSRSRSLSRSRSQSRSRSRSKKQRYSSRSRSRSKSHSRDRAYPREYQNNRGFRGYNRGFRRPYYYHGRGRGFYPRGRYQRGGGGYGGYRPYYWHRGPQEQYEHRPQSPKRWRSRSRSRSRSGSRDSSARSRRSSSTTSSRSVSPQRRDNPARLSSKAVEEAQAGGGGDGKPGGGEVGVTDKPYSGWQGLADNPKQAGHQLRSAVVVTQGTQAGPHAGSGFRKPSPSFAVASDNSATSWKSMGTALTSKPSPPLGSTPASSGFGVFSKEDVRTGSRSTISSEFQKFLEEHRDKRQVSERQTGTDQEPIAAGEEAGNNTARGPARQKGPLFLYSDEEEETGTAPHRQRGAEAKHKGKTSLSARDLYGQWEEPAGRRGAGSEGDPEGVEEELCRARRQGDTSRLSRVCPPHKSLRGSSPVLPSGWDRGMKEASPPPRNSGKKGVEFDLCKNAFCSDPGSFSGLLVKERLVSRDLVDPVRKDEEFRTIFQHLQIPQLCWSSNEMFDQHIVGIVHQIKAKHFQSSGLTLNERFAMYQRRAAEKDLRPRKSPEIHRRIDVSPSAFMKHSFLFEEMENSRTSGYKDQVKIMKDYSMDLQPDKERRKKHSNKERDHRWAGGRESGDSRGSSQERSTEKPSKRHKKSKKSKKKRERSRSSSTSSLRREGDYPSEEPPEKAFPKAPWGPRDHGDPMERGQPRGGFISGGQGWSRANHIGNNSGSINPSTEIPVRPPEDEWEQEDGPKSKKYYLHEERKGEQWPDSRGHGRGKFLYCGRSPKWSHDKFQGKAEEGELSESEQDPQEGDKKGAFSSKQ